MNNSSTIPDTALDDFRYIGSDSIADKNFTKEMLGNYTPEDLERIARSLEVVGNFLFKYPLTMEDLQIIRCPADHKSSLRYVLVLTDPSSQDTVPPELDKIYQPRTVSYSPSLDPTLIEIQNLDSITFQSIILAPPFLKENLFHLYTVLLQERMEREYHQRVTPTIS